MSETTKEGLLEALQERREKSMEVGQVDNASLYAGSPMYYYCKHCGVQVAVKPEDWYEDPPPSTCADCQELLDKGWHDGEKPEFPLWTGPAGRIPNLVDE